MPSRDETTKHERVGRLAPSPTGHLHLGHARTFLLAWWDARSREGRVVLRIEDLDVARVRPDMLAAAERDLEWLGLDWDGAPLLQSSGIQRMRAAIDSLVERGLAYPCVCSRGDVRAASAPHAGDVEPRYPGTCRGRFESVEQAESTTGRAAGVRFLVPEAAIEIRDRIAPLVSFDPQREVGDFLIARRDGTPAYQLAVVVDDAFQGVTDVVRGDDLLPSTARQWRLGEALGLPHPEYAHVPLVTDAEGRRLAKRALDLGLWELRARGVDARTVVAWAAKSAGLEVPERVTAREITGQFSLARLPREPVRLGPAELATLLEQTR